MHTATASSTIARCVAGLLTLGAVAALAAGCTTGPAPSRTPDAEPTTASDPAPSDSSSSDHATSDSSETPAPGTPAPGDEALGAWGDTVSTERFAPETDGSYLAMMHLHGGPRVTEMSADDIAGTEFLAGAEAQCEGEAVLDGAAATCTFIAMDGSGGQQFAQVRLVPTAFGGTALLFGVTDEAGAELDVAEAPQGLQAIEGEDVSAVTEQELADAAISAVMMGSGGDGEPPTDLSVRCEVSDGGEHGLCEVTGTPDGGGDGTWYASAQRGFDGDRAAYLFTQLPQE